MRIKDGMSKWSERHGADTQMFTVSEKLQNTILGEKKKNK